MSAEPDRIEITAWMNRTGATVREAVTHYWPEAKGPERVRLIERIKAWRKRDRAKAAREPVQRQPLRVVGPDEQPEPSPQTVEPEEPEVDLTSMTASEQARFQMREIHRLHRRAGAKNDARSVVILDQRLSALRGELEEARKREGVGAAPLHPAPASVALDLVKADRQIAELAALVEELNKAKE